MTTCDAPPKWSNDGNRNPAFVHCQNKLPSPSIDGQAMLPDKTHNNLPSLQFSGGAISNGGGNAKMTKDNWIHTTKRGGNTTEKGQLYVGKTRFVSWWEKIGKIKRSTEKLGKPAKRILSKLAFPKGPRPKLMMIHFGSSAQGRLK